MSPDTPPPPDVTPLELTRASLLPAPAEGVVQFKKITISLRSRIITWFFRLFLRPMLARMTRASDEKIAKIQLRISGLKCPNTYGLPLEYTAVGQVPGHVLGDLRDTSKPVILWLHGGAFFLPAAPVAHMEMVADLCAQLGAHGYLPDYRLAPRNRFPAALDDCERAYRSLLELGFAANRIVLGGDSAGGNLMLGLLQRLRKQGLPMPACGIPASPATELGRIHAPMSRTLNKGRDPVLPIAVLQRIDEMYAGEWDASDPELSPIYADCSGFPPLYLLTSDSEVLMDDTVMFTRRAKAHGVDARCVVWPKLPHAFPLFGSLFAEVKQVRAEMLAFIREHLH